MKTIYVFIEGLGYEDFTDLHEAMNFFMKFLGNGFERHNYEEMAEILRRAAKFTSEDELNKFPSGYAYGENEIGIIYNF